MEMQKEQKMLAFHTRIHAHEAAQAMCRFIESGLAPLGFNTLILELNPGYTFQSFPEFSTGTLCRQDIKEILHVCREHDIKLIPLFQCLSHMSNYGGKPWPLFEAHPEFLERRNVSPQAKWPEIYCHSWCCEAEEIYDYIFPMMDEIIDDFETDIMHIGMDEVFDIGEDECPRCRGKDKAALFAQTVHRIDSHLQKRGIRTMMWGDRLLNARELGYQMWEADRFGLYRALHDREKIRRDILIADWHYDRHEHGYPSIDLFLQEGFTVLPSVFMDPKQTEHLLGYLTEASYIAKKLYAPGRVGGIICTHWDAFDEERREHLQKGIGSRDSGDTNTSYFVGQVLACVAKLCAGKI